MSIKNELLDGLIRCKAVQFGDFTLTSGKKSQYYVNIKKASTLPDLLRLMATCLAEQVEGERIAGMELGAVPLAVATSLETNIPYLMVRKGDRAHGTGKGIEGAFKSGERVTIVEDVATSGGSIVKTAKILTDAGLKVVRALVVVDREEGASTLMKEHGIPFQAILTASELLISKNSK